jgi:hypothetical protein
MSETRGMTPIPVELLNINIAASIQKYGSIAIDCYKNNRPVDALPSLFALRAFAFGLPTPYDLSVELIDILANTDRKPEELTANFLSLATAIIDFHQKNKDSDTLIPHAVSLRILALALVTRLNAKEQAELLRKLNGLIVLDQPDTNNPFDTLLYPARAALNPQGLVPPSVYRQLDLILKQLKPPTVPDKTTLINNLAVLIEYLDEDNKKFTELGSATYINFDDVIKSNSTTGKALQSVQALLNGKQSERGQGLDSYFNAQNPEANALFSLLISYAKDKGKDESIRSHARYCLRGIIYFLFPQAPKDQASVPQISKPTDPVFYYLWEALSKLYLYEEVLNFFDGALDPEKEREFDLAGELLQIFGEKGKYCRSAWALPPGSNFIKSLFTALHLNDNEQEVLLALQFINVVAQNENIFAAKAEKFIQGLLQIPEELQWKSLDFKPKSYAVAAALAPFLEGCAHEAILRENDAPLVTNVAHKKAKSIENKPWFHWFTLHRASLVVTSGGFSGALIISALLLALPSKILSLWLNPLLWVGYASVGLFILGGLAYFYDSVFISPSHALSQDMQDEIANNIANAKLVEAYEQKHAFVFGSVTEHETKFGFFEQQAVDDAHSNIKYNVTELLKAQGLNPTNALEFFGADEALSRYGYPEKNCRYPELLHHVRPENDMALFKPFFSSKMEFDRLLQLFSNLQSAVGNALLLDFLLYEIKQLEKRGNFYLDTYERGFGYTNTAIHHFLDGPFQRFIDGTPQDQPPVTPFIRLLIKEIASRPICIMQLLRQETTTPFHLSYLLQHANDTQRDAILDIFFLTEDSNFSNDATKSLHYSAMEEGDSFFAETFPNTSTISQFASWLEETLPSYKGRMQQMVDAKRFWKFLNQSESRHLSRNESVLLFNEQLKNLCFLDPTDMIKKLFLDEDGTVNYGRMQRYIQQDASSQEDKKLKTIIPKYAVLFVVLSAIENNFSHSSIEGVKKVVKDTLGTLASSGNKEDMEIYQLAVKIWRAAVEYKQNVDSVNSVPLKELGEFLQECSTTALDVMKKELEKLEMTGDTEAYQSKVTLLLEVVKLKQMLDRSESAESKEIVAYLESCKNKDVTKRPSVIPAVFNQDGSNKIIARSEVENNIPHEPANGNTHTPGG